MALSPFDIKFWVKRLIALFSEKCTKPKAQWSKAKIDKATLQPHTYVCRNVLVYKTSTLPRTMCTRNNKRWIISNSAQIKQQATRVTCVALVQAHGKSLWNRRQVSGMAALQAFIRNNSHKGELKSCTKAGMTWKMQPKQLPTLILMNT